MAALLAWASERLTALRATLTPPPSCSELAAGFLTPGEFVAAGDALVSAAPSWRWAGGEPALGKGYLPPGKQFLLTCGVPCRARAAGCAPLHATPDGADQFEHVGGGEPSDPAADLAPAEPQRAPALRRYDVSIVYEPYFRTPAVFLAGFAIEPTGDRRALSPAEVLEDVAASCAAVTATVTSHPHGAGSGGGGGGEQSWVRIHPCKHAAAMRVLLAAAAAETGAGEPGGGCGGGTLGSDGLGACAGATAVGAAGGGGVAHSVDATVQQPPQPQQRQQADAELLLLQAYLPTFLKLLASMLPTIDYDFSASAGM